MSSTVQMDDGVRLNVKVLGEDPSRIKPLLIALHGAPGFSTHEEPEASFGFLSGPFRILVFDARGSGASDLIGPYNHERWIKDIEALRRWVGVEKFVLAGGSYGGFISLDYALAHGDRLLGLILRDTWANGLAGSMTALANIVTSPILKVDVERQIRVWSGTLFDDKDFEEAVKEILPIYAPPAEHKIKAVAPSSSDNEFHTAPGKRIAYNSATQNAAFNVNMPRFDVRAQLKNIKVPTLVIVGRYDKVTPLHFSEDIARGIPSANLEIFEHSGHSPPLDEPQRFREKILEFLKAEILL